MAKLYIYHWVKTHASKVAEGDGDPSEDDFTVEISSGEVTKGTTYEIRYHGKSGDYYNCKVGATKGETANFARAATNKLVSIDRLGAARAARSALLATQKDLTISIDTEDLKTLKTADYKLCFAKKVGDSEYNVVWQSYFKYLVTNTFSWTPQYQLFGSNVFIENVCVRTATNLVTIGLGEQSVLSSAGVLGNPSTEGPETSITMVNQYGVIHPGINQLSTGIDGSQVSTPIYVAEKPIVMGSAELTPVEKVLIWFEQNVSTSTMFSTSRSMSVEVDLTYANQATRLYSGGKWVTPG